MVLEKAAGGKGRSPKDAHPAHFLAPHKGAQAEVDAHRYAHRQKEQRNCLVDRPKKMDSW